MPKLPDKSASDTTPEGFRPYYFHGIELPDWKPGKENGYGDCLLCGGEGKFSVHHKTSQYRCWKCGEVGECRGFVEHLYAMSFAATNSYRELADNRKLLNADTVMYWGAAKSISTQDWILPAYKVNGDIAQVYRYLRTNNRMTLLPTPTIKPGHGLFGVPLYDANKPNVMLCEGPWDAMALWEILGQTKDTGQGFAPTGNEAASLRAETSVLAVPGCMVFFSTWLPLFSGKIVTLLFDSDHPKKHPDTGATIEPAGHKGMQRVVGLLASADNPPAEIRCINWGEGGYDPSVKSGYDIRDLLTDG